MILSIKSIHKIANFWVRACRQLELEEAFNYLRSIAKFHFNYLTNAAPAQLLQQLRPALDRIHAKKISKQESSCKFQ